MFFIAPLTKHCIASLRVWIQSFNINLKHQIGESNESMPDPYKIISTDIKAEYQPLPKADMANVLLPVLYTVVF